MLVFPLQVWTKKGPEKRDGPDRAPMPEWELPRQGPMPRRWPRQGSDANDDQLKFQTVLIYFGLFGAIWGELWQGHASCFGPSFLLVFIYYA